MTQKLALIGFGTVGQGLAQILRDKGVALRQNLDFEAQIVAVSTRSRGSLYDPAGLDIGQLLEVMRASGQLADYPDSPGLQRGWDNLHIIRESNADTVVEISYTNLTSGQPAIDHCRAAFESGKHVVTANKGPVALAYQPLSALATATGARFGIEGTVMSGTPSLRLALVGLAGNDIIELRGILNGTTNFILTKMEEGLSYEAALQQAQELGYAEADPTADVEGHDAAGKVAILANVVWNVALKPAEVVCQGITHLTQADIQQAKIEGKRWKLIGRARLEAGQVVGTVQPQALPLADPLANVMDATNAVTFECDLMGPVTLVGAG
ncbi:MAG: homoserine dehydrogenase, partial [Anaerolineae bacterium]